MDWIGANRESLQVVLTAATTLVWIFYLHLFLVNMRHQRRPHILITLGAGTGLKTRFFVTNLGLEPIYLSEILVDLEAESGRHCASITDRTELSNAMLSYPSEATNQRPLRSGEFVDIGDFATLVERTKTAGLHVSSGGLHWIEITAVAVTAGHQRFVGARRRYQVRYDDSHALRLVPETLAARQIVSWLERRKLLAQLKRNLGR